MRYVARIEQWEGRELVNTWYDETHVGNQGQAIEFFEKKWKGRLVAKVTRMVAQDEVDYKKSKERQIGCSIGNW